MDLMKALRDLLSSAEAEPDTGTDDEETPTAIDGPDEADQPAEAGDGDTTADEAADDTEAETLPDSEVSDAELRDALNTLGAENEALRNQVEMLRSRIAELGGDDELDDMADDMGDDTADDETTDDESDEYDDDAATADIDNQKKQIAALSGAK